MASSRYVYRERIVRVVLAAVGVVSLALGGCSSVFNQMIPDYRDAGRRLNGGPLVIPPDLEDRFRAEVAGAPSGHLRRELLFALIAQSDVKCADFLTGIGVYSNTSQAGLGTASLALSTAGGLATPEESANLLSGLSAFATGTDRIITDSVYGGRDFSLVYAAVRTGRNLRRGEIFNAANQGAFDTWGQHSIFAYVTAYDLDCTINYGLQQISEALQERSTETRDTPAAPNAADANTIAVPTPTN
jgi:hypothetical protein